MRAMTTPRELGLPCMAFSLALAGCQAGGILWPDLPGAVRNEAPAEREAVSDSAGEPAQPVEARIVEGAAAKVVPRAAESQAPVEKTAPVARPTEAAVAPEVAGWSAATAPEPVARVEPPPAAPREVARAEVPSAAEPVGPTEPVAAPAEPAGVGPGGERAAAREVAAVQPPAEEEGPVAEPPRSSNFWFYFFVLLAMALVGAAAWFFLQPPWKRGRWWRLFKAYVRDWRTGGFEETPSRGSPSLGVLLGRRAAPVAGDARGEEEERKPEGQDEPRRPPAQEFGPETVLHIEDASGDDETAQPRKAKIDSSRYGEPLKPRDTTGVAQEDIAREVAAASRRGRGPDRTAATDKAGSAASEIAEPDSKGRKKTRRKRTTNVTLPVISRGSPKKPGKRKEG